MQSIEEGTTLSTAPRGDAEGRVITESQAEVIRQMHRDGMAKKAIARGLELDIKTVRRAIREPWGEQRRVRTGHKLEQFADWIRSRAPEVGWNAAVLYRELREAGYEGSYPVVSRFVRPLRPAVAAVEPVVRFETDPGKQAQVDWGMLGVWIGEQRVSVHIFTMILGYSRRIFAYGYLHERIGHLLEAHERAFEHFGGRTETILYDNPRTIVTRKDEASGHVEWNRTFQDRMDFYGVEPRLCRYYRAQTKGKVESGVKYVKHNGLAGKRFASLEALNEWLVTWSRGYADERIHGTTHEKPRERFERSERAAMIPVERRAPSVSERSETRAIDSDGTVVVDTNRYPVPYEWMPAIVTIRRSEELVLIEHAGRTLSYARVLGRHQKAEWKGKKRELPQSVRAVDAPPRFDPGYLAAIGAVEIRSLESYAEVIA